MSSRNGSKNKPVQFRRKREGKTDYVKRLKTLSGRKVRLVVRGTLKNISVQLINYEPAGDKVLLGIHSSALKKYGWLAGRGNLPSAYLTGYLLGHMAVKKGITEAIVDTGLVLPIAGGRLYACVKGAVDAGMSIPIDESTYPSEDRIVGKHIAAYSHNSKSGFTEYTKNKVNPADMEKLFQKVKSAIEGKK